MSSHPPCTSRNKRHHACHWLSLNSFRHQRSWRLESSRASRQSSTCSTPFGIRDHGGQSFGSRSSIPIRCSTPFGIRDHGGTVLVAEPKMVTSAQRLSASEIMAGPGRGDTRRVRTVLNAFRHQRSWRSPGSLIWAMMGLCSTPFGIRDHGGLVAPGSSWPDDQCSTPFGIRDHGGPGVVRRIRSKHVLNAFRHQRSWRMDTILDLKKRKCAQRLSASEIMAAR